MELFMFHHWTVFYMLSKEMLEVCQKKVLRDLVVVIKIPVDMEQVLSPVVQ